MLEMPILEIPLVPLKCINFTLSVGVKIFTRGHILKAKTPIFPLDKSPLLVTLFIFIGSSYASVGTRFKN